jgi:hypothetical protein
MLVSMRRLFALPILLALLSCLAFAQESSTSTDVFIMGGTDVTRPTTDLRTNLNIGVGHTEKFLKKSPIGDELTFSYTYENGGGHGFFHSVNGSHTENIGIMKNFTLPKLVNKDKVSFYTWPLIGVTSMTGTPKVENRLYLGAAFGVVYHFNNHFGVWTQATWNKVVTTPWYMSYTTGPTFSF